MKSGVILSCIGVVWWSAVLQEDEIIVWIQTAAFWQQGRLQKVNISLLVDFSLLRVDEKISVFPFHDTPALTINFFENQFLWWQNACKRCFMTCNTISLVSQLIWKRFRWKFIDIFEDVCSLHTCFFADWFHLLCCITPCESSGRFFFGPPGITDGLRLRLCSKEQRMP